MKRGHEPYAFRRHLKTCQHFGKGGRDVRTDKCNCPFHVDGVHNGKRVQRQSLKTRSRQIAERRLADLVRRLDAELLAEKPGQAPVTVRDAAERFLRNHGPDVQPSTLRKYKTKLDLFVSFCERHRTRELNSGTLETIENYRRTRQIGLVTWKVELQALRTFYGYCIRHNWTQGNPALEARTPRNIKPNDVVPYTAQEERQILAACHRIGGGKYNRSGARYEQLRACAMVMLLRATALRISDVALFRKGAVSWDQGKSTWRIMLRTQKSGEPVFLPIPETIKLALDAVPLPRNAARDCPYYFWNGQTSQRAVVGIAERTLAAVFKKSVVKKAHAHRYRHTLATRLLEQGATFEQVADILGNSPAVVRKHYGKWARGRQDNIDRLMMAHFRTGAATFSVTPQSHEKTGALN